jgi:hypothetical protein
VLAGVVDRSLEDVVELLAGALLALVDFLLDLLDLRDLVVQ